jgi:hypothetical protein
VCFFILLSIWEDDMIKWPTRLGTLAVGGALIAGGILATASDAAAATPACGNGSLAVTRAPSQGAAGHGAFWLLFRNASHTTCSLRGYPGLDALDSHGNVLAHAQRTLSGYMGGPGVVNTVLVAPGGFASATVEWLNFNPSNGTNCRFSTSVATTPPNTTHTVHLPVSVSICRLQVHPTVAGTSGHNAFAGAQVQWIAGSKALDVQMSGYWLKAENDLKAAGGAFSTQIAQLKQLISLPDAQRTPAQNAAWVHDISALNTFFGTPGLYI